MRRALTINLLLVGLLVAAMGILAGGASASPAATRTVRYRGLGLRVPAGWPVFRLAQHPGTCVRFDRHAVYLGTPSDRQVCPTTALGRTEAILVLPKVVPVGDAGIGAGSVARIVRPARHVTILATWQNDPSVIARALGVRSLAAAKAAANRRPAPARAAAARPAAARGAASRAASGSSASIPGEAYTGKGFDTCSTPSAQVMSDWHSTYHAIGVYVGGVNMACSQSNLTSEWVQGESDLGWHLVPIYAGLQAPGTTCYGCATLTYADAAKDGAADAQDAVADAERIGLGTGNPIYDDMEAYDEGGKDTTAVLAYLQSWTEELHSLGYLSGVYSSDDSGIYDLANAPAGYVEPDDIWFANLNDEANTDDSELGSTQWIDNTRLHQYENGVDATHGGASLQIDEDYLDAATAAAGSAADSTSDPSDPPAVSGPPTITGAPLAGQTLTEVHARWTNDPTSYTYEWETCPSASGSGGVGVAPACTEIAGASAQTLTLTSAEVGDTIRVIETAANAAGAGTPDVSATTPVVASTPSSGYWLASASGDVLTSPGAHGYGSPFHRHVSGVVGLAPTPRHRGYWVGTRSGAVYAYGNAQKVSGRHVTAPVRAVVAAPRGGFWLLTSHGNLFNLAHAPFYGSPAHSHVKDDKVVAIAPTPNGRGYWIVDSDGRMRAYGDAVPIATPKLSHPVIDAVAAPDGGLWLLTAYGNLDNVGGAPFYGSPAHSHLGLTTITGMTRTADGDGYWLVDRAGRVFAYGDAATFPAQSPKGSVVSITGG